MMKKKILIIGPGGYLGSALLKFLPEEFKIIGYGHNSQFDKLKNIRTKNLDLIEGDINEKEKLEKICKKVDVVINTAGIVGEGRCKLDYWGAIKTNIRGVKTLAEILKENKTPPLLIHLSTQSVYGTFKKRPMPLKENVELSPDDFYGSTKAESENYLYDINSIILRPTNIYGYGSGIGYEKDVISKFVSLAIKGKDIVVFGDGSQKIDFINIKDVVSIITELINKKNKNNIIYNIGNGKGTKIIEVAQLVEKLVKEEFNVKTNIIFKDDMPDKVWPDRWVSINKLKKDVSYKQTKLIDGIKELIEKHENYTSR